MQTTLRSSSLFMVGGPCRDSFARRWPPQPRGGKNEDGGRRGKRGPVGHHERPDSGQARRNCDARSPRERRRATGAEAGVSGRVRGCVGEVPTAGVGWEAAGVAVVVRAGVLEDAAGKQGEKRVVG